MPLTPEQIEQLRLSARQKMGTPLEEEAPSKKTSLPVARAVSKKASPVPEVSAEAEEDSGAVSSFIDLLLGAQEGATFHLGKRGVAAAKAALSDKTYEEELTEIQKALDEAKERSPILFGTGELGGAFLNPVPGTLAKMGAEAIGASKLAEVVGSGASKLAEKIGVPSAKIVGEGGSEMVPIINLLEKPTTERIGALAGRMISGGIEAGLVGAGGEAVEGRYENIPRATLASMLIGSSFPLAGEAMGRAGKKLEDYDWFQKAKRGFSLSKEGIGISSISGQNTIVKRLTDSASKIKDIAKSTVNSAKAEFNRYIDQSKNIVDDAGKVTGPYRFTTADPQVGNELKSVMEFLTENKQLLDKILQSNTFLKDMLSQRTMRRTGPMMQEMPEHYQPTFEQLSDLRRYLIEGLSKAKPEDLTRELREQIRGNAEKGIPSVIDTVEKIINQKFPRYSVLKNNIDVAAKPVEKLLGQTVDEDARTIFFSNLSEEQQNKKLEDLAYRFLERYFRGGTISGKARSIMDDFFNELTLSAKQVGKQSSKFNEEIASAYEGASKFPNPDEMAKQLKKQFPFFNEEQLKDFVRGTFVGENIAMLKKEAMESAANVAALSALRGVRPEADEMIRSLIPLMPGKGSPLSIIHPGTWLSTGITEGSVWAGKAAGSAVPKIYSKARNFNYDKLIEYAKNLSLSDKPSVANIGRAGLEALQQNPTNKAVFINTIMTNPTIRQYLGIDLSKKDEEDEKSYSEEDLSKRTQELLKRKRVD